MSKETFTGMMEKELTLAKIKHPLFVDRMICQMDIENAKTNLANFRKALLHEVENNSLAAVTVLLCEVCEFVEAYIDGDYDAALVECAQCGAVFSRIFDRVQKESEVKE